MLPGNNSTTTQVPTSPYYFQILQSSSDLIHSCMVNYECASVCAPLYDTSLSAFFIALREQIRVCQQKFWRAFTWLFVTGLQAQE